MPVVLSGFFALEAGTLRNRMEERTLRKFTAKDNGAAVSRNQQDLTEGPIFSGVLWFTLPFLLSNLLQTLYGTVDTLVIGKCGSSSGVSAVACGSQLLSLFTYLAIGLSAGGTVLVSQCIGSRDHRQGAKIVGNLIIDFAVVSLLLTAASAVFSPTFLAWLNVPSEAMT